MDFPSMNKLILIGRVVRGPKVEDVNGKQKAWLAIETQRDWNGNTYKDSISATAWGNAASSLGGISEGDIVCVEGRVGRRKYEQNGETKWVTEVTATSVSGVGSKEVGGDVDVPGDEIPF